MTPTPAQLSRYDQAHTRRLRQLDALIAAYQDMLTTHTPDVTIAGTAHYLATDVGAGTCAELLACAIERLAAPHDRPGGTGRETMPQ